MKETVFRAYDVRGIYPTEIDENLAEKIGKAFGTFIYNKAKKKQLTGEEIVISVGGDARFHTPSLKKSLIRGLLLTGIKVIDFGTLPTPVLYFAVAFKRLDGGVAVTASHNPKDYNGFKLCAAGGVCLSWETGIKDVLEIVKRVDFRLGGEEGEFAISDIFEEYKQYVSAKIDLRQLKGRKVVIDAGNGVCGKVAANLFETGGCRVVKLYCEPDGTFPNHEPDPVKKSNLIDLQKAVLESKADLGIAYDGDGDRVGFVGPDGKVLESHVVLSIFAKEALKNKSGSKIVFDVRSSKAVEDVIRLYGGLPVESRVGHSYIQAELLNGGCEFGGEHTGHYFFKENFGFDDGIFASLKFAEIVSKTVGGLDSLTKDIPAYFTSEEFRVFCRDDQKFGVMEKIKAALKKKHGVVETDGAKVISGDGWFLIRVSNTEPALTIRWEARTEESFNSIKEEIKNIIVENGLEVNL